MQIENTSAINADLSITAREFDRDLGYVSEAARDFYAGLVHMALETRSADLQATWAKMTFDAHEEMGGTPGRAVDGLAERLGLGLLQTGDPYRAGLALLENIKSFLAESPALSADRVLEILHDSRPEKIKSDTTPPVPDPSHTVTRMIEASAEKLSAHLER